MALSSYPEFQNRVVLVTGGASGIGRATAEAFASNGARLAIGDLDRVNGEQVVASINRNYCGSGEPVATFHTTDVTRLEDVNTLLAGAVNSFGRIDIAVNSAGISGPRLRTADYPLEEWHHVMDININGVFYSMKAEIDQMLNQGGGIIVNLASVAGLVGFPSHAAYSASKHAVVGLTKTAAMEYIRKGIRINALCPGFIDTPMVQNEWQRDPQYSQLLIQGVPARRLGTVEEVASAILYLCSDSASFFTGVAMAMDGGATA